MGCAEMPKVTLSTDCCSLLGVSNWTVGAQGSPALPLPGHLVREGLRRGILCEVQMCVGQGSVQKWGRAKPYLACRCSLPLSAVHEVEASTYIPTVTLHCVFRVCEFAFFYFINLFIFSFTIMQNHVIEWVNVHGPKDEQIFIVKLYVQKHKKMWEVETAAKPGDVLLYVCWRLLAISEASLLYAMVAAGAIPPPCRKHKRCEGAMFHLMDILSSSGSHNVCT